MPSDIANPGFVAFCSPADGLLSDIANAGCIDFYNQAFWFDMALNWPDSYDYSKILLSYPVLMKNEIIHRKNNYYANP